MKIDTSILIRFINNDLPAKKIEEIKVLIKKNNQIKPKSPKNPSRIRGNDATPRWGG